ncbi:uncharacterized protein LOC132054754 [Lycium ferocissimum]|uniref:uncharacterized protein LOC132054754 n=1 Tax=Lycium ferocissimum TaxID=112874 RepID=UPI002814B079|nr:uncharacterized protein LOC132054754 [Lycium ferocissimum]
MSQNASTVKVSLFWDGDIVEDNYSIRYSIKPKAHVKFPTTLNYETLVSYMHKRMKTTPTEIGISITGRYPQTISNGVVRYGMHNINDDESLSDYLGSPEEYRDLVFINVLEMYVEKIPREEVPQVQPIHGNTYGDFSSYGDILSGQVPLKNLSQQFNQAYNENWNYSQNSPVVPNMDVGQSSQFGEVDHSPHHDSAYEQQ